MTPSKNGLISNYLVDIIKYYILFSSLLILPITSFSQSIRINEAVSSNSNFIDEDGDSPDWFELYNYGNQSVSLKNWTVSDKDDNPEKWTFPDISIDPDEIITSFARMYQSLCLGIYFSVLGK